MKKIAKAMKAIGLVFRRPVLLNRVLSDPDTWKAHVISRHALPEGFPLVSFGQFCKDEKLVVSPVTFLDGGSLPTDLALLRQLAGWFDDCCYFEIGTWRGESVANVAEVAARCTTLNMSPDEMRARGLPERYIGLHGWFSRELKNVEHLYGNSRSFDFGALGTTYDLVFIDGDHHYDCVKHDTRQVVRHLIHERSIIVWHDYAYHPEALRFEVMAAILEGTPPAMHNCLFHAGHTKCAVYIPPAWGRKYHSTRFASPVEPEEFFGLEMEISSFRDRPRKGDHA